jgi:hypothetical protein
MYTLTSRKCFGSRSPLRATFVTEAPPYDRARVHSAQFSTCATYPEKGIVSER